MYLWWINTYSSITYPSIYILIVDLCINNPIDQSSINYVSINNICSVAGVPVRVRWDGLSWIYSAGTFCGSIRPAAKCSHQFSCRMAPFPSQYWSLSLCSPAWINTNLFSIFRLKKGVKYNYSGPRTRDGILDFANRVGGRVTLEISFAAFDNVN